MLKKDVLFVNLNPSDRRNATGIRDFRGELPCCEYCTAAQALEGKEELLKRPAKIKVDGDPNYTDVGQLSQLSSRDLRRDPRRGR